MTVQLQVINGTVVTPFDFEQELVERETVIARGLQSFMEVGRELAAIREGRLYRASYLSFEDYVRRRWPDLGSRNYADRVINANRVVENLVPIGTRLPMTESQARPLTVLTAGDQVEAWQRAVEAAGSGEVTAKIVEQAVRDLKAEASASSAPTVAEPDPPSSDPAGTWFNVVESPPEPAVDEPEEDEAPAAGLEIARLYMVDAWNALTPAERRQIIKHAPVGKDTKFNRTNDNVEWALWTWNPVTGCDHGCNYCYARDIANRFYTELPEEQRFAPVFRPSRLHAPRHMKVPKAFDPNKRETIGEKNVFTGSMTDLFGKWVPQEWIDAVFQEVVRASEWNFLFLTKFPQRLAEQDWPSNAWVGTTVDRQARVATAERSFKGVKAGVKWLSCEPLLERLTFTSLEMFDWVVIGGSSESSQTPEFQPPWEWVEHLWNQARAAGCEIYWKPNLKTRAREYPGGAVK